MQTFIVVKIKVGNLPDLIKEKYRKKFLKDIKEGVIVIDNDVEIISHTIQGEFGIEVSEEE